ncbi:MAG: 23S rRNA (adenine(2503)-C(2))-methyltransferase RlmN [Candidatus Scalinduaceae bacterium]
MRLKDGLRVESVIIQSGKRVTLCISSQVGCRRACKFCRTALMKLKRNLEMSEILDQLRFASEVASEDGRKKKDSSYLITNIVFMGMGEPLDNLENVGRAIEIMEDQAAFGYSRRRITVSTCGVLDTLLSLPEWGNPNLAISLNAAENSARDKIMPVNRRYPLHKLFSVLKKYPLERGRRITFEYILISGLNDSLEDAKKLVNLLRLVPSKVNLLHLNEFENLPLARASEEKAEAFRNHLLTNGIQTNVRPSRGLSIWAACGQLASQTDATGNN